MHYGGGFIHLSGGLPSQTVSTVLDSFWTVRTKDGKDPNILGLLRFGFLYIFYFRVRFCSWQNLGSGSVRSCWVSVLPISSQSAV